METFGSLKVDPKGNFPPRLINSERKSEKWNFL
jgi:hypothetical protein